jgi:hypothetical protein
MWGARILARDNFITQVDGRDIRDVCRELLAQPPGAATKVQETPVWLNASSNGRNDKISFRQRRLIQQRLLLPK